MAKLYKVRKKCMICGSVFYPKYAGSLYCEECKNRKKPVQAKKPVKKTVKKPANKISRAKAPVRKQKKVLVVRKHKPAKRIVKKVSRK